MMLPHFLKSYLYLNDYKTLCIALRTLADTSDTTGQSLMKLHRSQRFALETEPQSENSSSNFQQLVPIAAFLLDHKHLTCPLPWLENDTLLSTSKCLEILSDLLIVPHREVTDSRPIIKLASASLYLRFETDADLPSILSVIREILERHAPTLKTVSITVCSQAPRPLRHTRALEAASETALSFEDHPESKQLNRTSEYIPLVLNNIVFPELESLQLSLPFTANDLKLPKIQSLHLSYLNDEIISLWSKDVQNDDIYIKRQAEAIARVIQASALTLRSLTISGAVRLRLNNSLFDPPLYLPSLKSVNLGWTTAAELESLHLALLVREKSQLREVLTYPISVHTALSRAESLSDIAISFDGDEGTTDIPPRLPTVRHVIFNGPLRMGLTDRHLAIYAQVIPRGKQEELLLQYGILNVTLAGCLEFRRALREYCHCTIFRHPASLLHKILARRSFKDAKGIRLVSGSTAGGLDFPSRHSRSKLKDLFAYEHITPDVRTNWRKVTRFETLDAYEAWPRKGAASPPTVGRTMTGRDLFALEFWQLPQLIRQDENSHQIENVYELWDSDSFVSEDLRRLYDEELVRKYVCEREAHYSFDSVTPWWERRARNIKT